MLCELRMYKKVECIDKFGFSDHFGLIGIDPYRFFLFREEKNIYFTIDVDKDFLVDCEDVQKMLGRIYVK